MPAVSAPSAALLPFETEAPARSTRPAPPPGTHLARIPSLDGVRAFAIVTVILLHSGDLLHLPVWWVPDGVSIFFVLSGFLTTSLLLREYTSTRTVDLSAFYRRRAFRILPPMLAYLGVTTLLCLATGSPVNWRSLADSVLFIRDYAGIHGPGAWVTEHLWSLAVEEQFYLLYPLLAVFLLQRYGRRTLAFATLLLIGVAPLLRVAGSALHLFPHRVQFMFHTRMDAMMAGCLFALLCSSTRFERVYRRVDQAGPAALVLFPLYTLVLEPFLIHFSGYGYYHAIGMTVSPLATGFVILWLSRNPGSPVGRVLNAKPVVFVGVLSYSIYLWQTWFLHGDSPASPASYPLKLWLILLTATLSYYSVEQPFLALRRRWETRVVRTPRRPQGALETAHP